MKFGVQTGAGKHRKQGGGGEKRKWKKGKAEEVKPVFSGELCPHKELSLLLSGTGLAATAWPSACRCVGDTCSFSTLSPYPYTHTRVPFPARPWDKRIFTT